MIVNPINGQKYPVTSNIGRQVLKKYLNTYKYGGSDGEIVSSEDISDEPATDDYLSNYDILRYFRSLRRLVRTYFDHRINNPEQLTLFNNILDSLERHITNVRSMYERSEAENIRILAAINSALEEKDNEIRMLNLLLQACSPAPEAG